MLKKDSVGDTSAEVWHISKIAHDVVVVDQDRVSSLGQSLIETALMRQAISDVTEIGPTMFPK